MQFAGSVGFLLTALAAAPLVRADAEPVDYRATIVETPASTDTIDGSLRLSLADAADASAAPALSQGTQVDENAGAADLAKKLQNPVADLISVPLQLNYDDGFGPNDGGKWTLNIQPVIPVSISENWNVIIRTILPVIYQESPAVGVSSEAGLGDIVQSFFFSPKEPVNGWIVGFGPVFLWPSATDDLLGGEKWGAGPTLVVLKQESGWTYGALANHIWSYAGDDDRAEVNATFIQPFISYTFPTFTTIGILTETTYDWSDNEWNVPIIGQVSQLMKFGKLPVQFTVGVKYFADSPPGGAEWGARFAITFLFPK